MHEPARNPLEASALEDALTTALAALEAGGEEALEQVLATHGHQAGRLREALTELRRTDLLVAPASAMPTQLGEFRIRELLGAGGMGVVYLAEQCSLGREVALKVVRPEMLFFDGARERFRREIDAVAKLEHPAIVPILATGSADGIPYYAMPRIRGRSAEAVVKVLAAREAGELSSSDLRTALREGVDASESDLDSTFAGAYWQACVRLVRKAALGIDHAHARGILHRDLKPSNLMLTADGQAIVLDFGLAHARGDAKLTRTGAAAGSPAYMAPEQVRGEPADERTDVYGLAATLHCLLGLRPPFVVDDPEVLRSQILAGTRQRLTARSSLPTALALVLDTAMEVDRKRRYASAAAFANDLQAVLDGTPIGARQLPLRVRVQRLAGRNRVLATIAAAGLVFVVVLPTLLLWQQQQANLSLSAQVRRSDRSVKVSIDAVEKQLAAIARERMMHVPAAQDVAAEMMVGAIALFDELAVDPTHGERVLALRIQALLRLADIETARGRFDDALVAARRATLLCGDGELTGNARLRRGTARRMLAGLLLDTRRDDEVEAIVKASWLDLAPLVAMPELRERAQANIANLHSHTAQLAEHRGDAAAQEQALRDAIACCRESDDPLALASAQSRLGALLCQRDQAEQALTLVAAAIRIATSPEAPRDGWPVPLHVEAGARTVQANALGKLGREQEAVHAYGRALAAFELFLHDYPEESTARRARGGAANNLALLHVKREEWQVVRTLLEGACRDQLMVLERLPEDLQALQFLGNHRRTLAISLYHVGDLDALEPVARDLGKMTGSPHLTVGAARGLMRCAAAAEPTRAVALRAEVLDLLVEAHRRNGQFRFDDPLFAPLRDDPRFQAVASKSGG